MVDAETSNDNVACWYIVDDFTLRERSIVIVVNARASANSSRPPPPSFQRRPEALLNYYFSITFAVSYPSNAKVLILLPRQKWYLFVDHCPQWAALPHHYRRLASAASRRAFVWPASKKIMSFDDVVRRVAANDASLVEVDLYC